MLTLSGVRVDGSELERGISAYGNSALTLILDDCEVSADHYAINIAGTNSAPKVIVRNSDIKEVSGYCAFQTWSANTVAKFEGCTLMGNNKWSGNSDDFATIVINSGATNVNLTFKNCRI